MDSEQPFGKSEMTQDEIDIARKNYDAWIKTCYSPRYSGYTGSLPARDYDLLEDRARNEQD